MQMELNYFKEESLNIIAMNTKEMNKGIKAIGQT